MKIFTFAKRNLCFIFRKTWQLFTSIFSLISLLGISLDQIVFHGLPITCSRILLFCLILLLIFIVSVFFFYINNRVLVFKTKMGKKIYVKYGDIFDKNILSSKGRKNIVIPFNRCFDTIVDNDLISEKTIHGKFLKYIYKEKFYTQDSLNEYLQNKLKQEEYTTETLNRKEKRKGNLKRYPIGTIAELKISDKENYFLLGLSKFDNNLVATSSKEDFFIAIQRIIEFCNKRSQGSPVLIPIIGTGLSRLEISKQEALEFIFNILKMNENLLVCDIYIIISFKDKEEISIYGL